ncbi:MAG: ACT domain-containing protein [Lachnospirales bacterium]
MKYIVTVVGLDKVGIIGSVCSFLSENEVNILDISQTITKDYFNMFMIVEFKGSNSFEEVHLGLDAISKKIGVDIKIQNEEVFQQMHRI